MRFMMIVKHAEKQGLPPQAVESAIRFMELQKKHWPRWEGETEVRQMVGPEDFSPNSPHADRA